MAVALDRPHTSEEDVVRIWFQLISSEANVPHFFAEVRRQCVDAAGPGTEVTVRGTTGGGVLDQYESMLQVDGTEVMGIAAAEVVPGGYDVYAMANCLDPALDGLREIVDIPVVSLMEVGCFVSSLLGDRFGVIVPNAKMRYRVRDQIVARGHERRLVEVRSLRFSHVPDMDRMFVDETVAEQVIAALDAEAKILVEAGAEVVLVPAPAASLLARERITSLHGAVVLDMYAALVTFAEALGSLSLSNGARTARIGRFAMPPADAVAAGLGLRLE